MTEVSEAEVEAAAEAIRQTEGVRSKLTSRHFELARAALTAAAQVRAQAQSFGDNPLPGQVKVADPTYERGWKWAFPNPAEKPAVMPIYGATEDLQQDSLVQATAEPAEADRDHPGQR